jgi:RNA ligase
VTTAATQTLELYDLLDRAAIAAALDDGYIRQQVHPSEPLAILNYTEKAAYENVWNPVTLTCRGLIWNTATGQVVARPYPKFFNYGQVGAASVALNALVEVSDKQDGSLGILYQLPSGGWAVATRGSFASEQAVHATEVFNSRYSNWVGVPAAEWTVLFEIVYPTNRIVCDYGDLDDLVLLGAVEITSGNVVGPQDTKAVLGWPGPATEVFPAATFADALAMAPRPNAEGVVVRELYSDAMLKIKQEDYVALHRIVTGLNARTVWQHMVDGKPIGDLIEPLPDEFHDWVRNVAAGIIGRVETEVWRLEAEYTAIRDVMPDSWQQTDRAGRGEFARLAVPHPDKWAMFNLLDGRDIRPELLKRAKPEPYLTPTGRTYTEDNA